MSRLRGPVETLEYGRMVTRMIRAWIRRCTHADEPELAQLIAARDELDRAIVAVIAGWNQEHERSWTDVARATGTTRQGARQRYGKAVADRLAAEGKTWRRKPR